MHKRYDINSMKKFENVRKEKKGNKSVSDEKNSLLLTSGS